MYGGKLKGNWWTPESPGEVLDMKSLEEDGEPGKESFKETGETEGSWREPWRNLGNWRAWKKL